MGSVDCYGYIIPPQVPMGSVDCVLPIKWALENSKAVDVFLIFTDCDTPVGHCHAAEALRSYRTTMKLPEAR